MKLTFLGSGSAFSQLEDNFNSNMVLESPTGKKLLIDCGSDARHSTAALNYKSKDFDAVFISHFHADHCGGLEWLAFTTKFDSEAAKPKLIIHPSMLNDLWDHVLSGGLESIQDVDCKLETYFEIYPIEEGGRFHWEGIDFEMVQTTHYYHNHDLVPSYGLFFSNQKSKVFITTDTKFVPDNYRVYYQKADLIFHDCDLDSKIVDNVHPSYEQLLTLPEEVKSKTWLYHYAGHDFPDAKGFRGFVKKGQVFEFK